ASREREHPPCHGQRPATVRWRAARPEGRGRRIMTVTVSHDSEPTSFGGDHRRRGRGRHLGAPPRAGRLTPDCRAYPIGERRTRTRDFLAQPLAAPTPEASAVELPRLRPARRLAAA